MKMHVYIIMYYILINKKKWASGKFQNLSEKAK